MRKCQIASWANGTFATRLQRVAEQNGGLSRLAAKAGMAPSTLSRYVGGRCSPNLSSAAALAVAGGVSLEWLGTGRGLETPAGVGREENVAFYDLQASAGPGLLPSNSAPPTQTIPLPLAQIRRQIGHTSTELCVILAHGDSMEPTIRSGALLLLDCAVSQLREGIFVVLRGDDVLVKRVQPRGPNRLRLLSDNEHYAPEDVPLDDTAVPVRLFGRVIWIGQPS